MDEVGVRRFENDEELLAPSDDEVDGEGILELEGVEAGVLDCEHRKPKQDAVEVMEGVQEDDGRLGVFVNDDETLEPREEEDDVEGVGKRDGVFVVLVVLDSEILSVTVMDEVGVR